MHLAVVNHHPDIAGIRTGQRPLFHLLHNPFQDGRHEAGVDRPAHDGAAKYELPAPRERYFLFGFDIQHQILTVHLIFPGIGHPLEIRLDYHPHLAELARAAGLFFMAVIGGSHFGNRFPVRDFRREKLHVDLILIRQLPFQDIQVVFALPLHDRLFQFFRILDQDRRILEMSPIQQLAELFVLSRLDRPDGRPVTGFREFDRFDLDSRSGGGQRLVRTRALQFHGAADVPGLHFRHFDAPFACHGEQLRYLLFISRFRIDQFHAFGHPTRNHPEEGHLAKMRFDGAFEYEQRGRSFAVGRDFAAVHVPESGSLDRAGSHVDNKLHQPFRPDIAFARSAEHRHQVAFGQPEFQPRTHFVLRQHAFVEIEFHQRLVVLGGRFGQYLIQFAGPLHFGFGDFEFLADPGIAFELVHFHQQHIDERIETGPRIDRILHQHGFHAGSHPQRFERIFPRSLLAVQLIDHGDDRFLVRTRIARLNFRPHFETVLRIQQHHAHVGYFERRKQPAAKVVRTRRIDDVQLTPVVLGEQDRRVNRPFIQMFDLRVVRQRIVVFDTAAAVDHLSVKSHCLGQSRLSRA